MSVGRPAADVLGEMRKLGTLVAITVTIIACGKEPSREASTATRVEVPVTPTTSSPVSEPAAIPEQADATQPCDHPETISPGALAATWPLRLGQCVTLATRIVRSIDITRAIVKGENASFIVWMSPDAAWVGLKTNTFVVMGSASVPLHGRTALPELLLQVRDDAVTQGGRP